MRGVWPIRLQRQERRLAGRACPTPSSISKQKGIRCVATDAPDLGGVDPKQALMTYWALGSREMVGVEFLHNVGKIPAGGVLPVRGRQDSRLPRRSGPGDRAVLTTAPPGNTGSAVRAGTTACR